MFLKILLTFPTNPFQNNRSEKVPSIFKPAEHTKKRDVSIFYLRVKTPDNTVYNLFLLSELKALFVVFSIQVIILYVAFVFNVKRPGNINFRAF